MEWLQRSFQRVFEEALERPSLSNLIKERMELYELLAHQNASTEVFHSHVSVLIKRSKNNRMPVSYDPNDQSLRGAEGLDAFEDFHVKMQLANWEAYLLTGFLKSLDNAMRC